MNENGIPLTQGLNQEFPFEDDKEADIAGHDAKFYAKNLTNKNAVRTFTPKSSCFFASESQPSVATVMGSINMYERIF